MGWGVGGLERCALQSRERSCSFWSECVLQRGKEGGKGGLEASLTDGEGRALVVSLR